MAAALMLYRINNNFVPKAGTLPYGIFKFNFFSSSIFRHIRGPKFTLGAPAPTGRHLAETLLYPKRVLYHICVFNFNFLAPVVS